MYELFKPEPNYIRRRLSQIGVSIDGAYTPDYIGFELQVMDVIKLKDADSELTEDATLAMNTSIELVASAKVGIQRKNAARIMSTGTFVVNDDIMALDKYRESNSITLLPGFEDNIRVKLTLNKATKVGDLVGKSLGTLLIGRIGGV